MKDQFQKKYNELCSQLGDSILKLEQLQDYISNIKSQIQQLNQMYTALSSNELKPTTSESSGAHE